MKSEPIEKVYARRRTELLDFIEKDDKKIVDKLAIREKLNTIKGLLKAIKIINEEASVYTPCPIYPIVEVIEEKILEIEQELEDERS